MTAQDRKKLAKAARELAMECVAGTAPEFGRGWHSNCALATVYRRAFGDDAEWMYFDWDDQSAIKSRLALTTANDYSHWSKRHRAVVAPLNALADALESAP
jgi:hypothetical protein